MSPINCDLVSNVRAIFDGLTQANEPLRTKNLLACEVVKSPESIKDVVAMIFAKAIDESESCPILARMCRVQMRSNSKFAPALFSRGKETLTAKHVDDDEFRKWKIGSVRFIGHLYLQYCLFDSFINKCLVAFLDEADELRKIGSLRKIIDPLSVECAVVLLDIIGKKRYQHRLSAPIGAEKESHSERLVFLNLSAAIIRVEDSRIRLMIINLIQLNARGWIPTAIKDSTETKSGERQEAFTTKDALVDIKTIPKMQVQAGTNASTSKVNAKEKEEKITTPTASPRSRLSMKTPVYQRSVMTPQYWNSVHGNYPPRQQQQYMQPGGAIPYMANPSMPGQYPQQMMQQGPMAQQPGQPTQNPHYGYPPYHQMQPGFRQMQGFYHGQGLPPYGQQQHGAHPMMCNHSYHAQQAQLARSGKKSEKAEKNVQYWKDKCDELTKKSEETERKYRKVLMMLGGGKQDI